MSGRLAPILGTHHLGAGTPSVQPTRPLWGEECEKPGQYHENGPLASPPLLQSGSRSVTWGLRWWQGATAWGPVRMPPPPTKSKKWTIYIRVAFALITICIEIIWFLLNPFPMTFDPKIRQLYYDFFCLIILCLRLCPLLGPTIRARVLSGHCARRTLESLLGKWKLL